MVLARQQTVPGLPLPTAQPTGGCGWRHALGVVNLAAILAMADLALAAFDQAPELGILPR